MRPKEPAKRAATRGEKTTGEQRERVRKREWWEGTREKEQVEKVQKCIPLHGECKNIATGFPASRSALEGSRNSRKKCISFSTLTSLFSLVSLLFRLIRIRCGKQTPRNPVEERNYARFVFEYRCIEVR